MQESNEINMLPLLLVVLLRKSGCLKNRRFDKSIRHLHRLLWNSALCAQGYPQKMWNVNSRAIPNLDGRILDTYLDFLDPFEDQGRVVFSVMASIPAGTDVF